MLTHRRSGRVDAPEHLPQSGDVYQYGCEIEFYVNAACFTVDEVAARLGNLAEELSQADILTNIESNPSDEDARECFVIKPDISLKENGLEISTPIADRAAIKRFMREIFKLIDEVGYTDEDTGLHFHISVIERNGANVPFFDYMLACDDDNLLSGWKPRRNYSRNVMDVLSCNTSSEARKIKNDSHGEWNLERIDSSHFEIRTIGGPDYHHEYDQIVDEFDRYANIFRELHQNVDFDKKLKLRAKHKMALATVGDEGLVEFAKGLSQIGLNLADVVG